ncbi:hypothetical protein SDC9_143641 [bioreactor metagenome]|uniref:Uncharacterized protein n=1 Tax=bioreactor metagenome TaxID=1076179 RepID=A0A645E510_9ZZZZ
MNIFTVNIHFYPAEIYAGLQVSVVFQQEILVGKRNTDVQYFKIIFEANHSRIAVFDRSKLLNMNNFTKNCGCIVFFSPGSVDSIYSQQESQNDCSTQEEVSRITYSSYRLVNLSVSSI